MAEKKQNKKIQMPDSSNEIILQELFEQVPYNIAVIDKDYNIVKANDNFKEYFGSWKKKKC